MVRRGFSLVEVIVALTLLSVGLLAVAGTAGLAATLARDAEMQEEGAFIASQIIDSLAVASAPASGRQQRGPFQLEWTVTPTERALTIGVRVAVVGGANAPQRFSAAVLRP